MSLATSFDNCSLDFFSIFSIILLAPGFGFLQITLDSIVESESKLDEDVSLDDDDTTFLIAFFFLACSLATCSRVFIFSNLSFNNLSQASFVISFSFLVIFPSSYFFSAAMALAFAKASNCA